MGARVEEHGPFVLFLQRQDGGHPFYARPAHPARGIPTVEDVLAARARQRALGVPESFEWVHEVTPGLLEVADRAGLKVLKPRFSYSTRPNSRHLILLRGCSTTLRR